MKTPAFWYGTPPGAGGPGLTGRTLPILLAPLGLLYGLGGIIRWAMAGEPETLGVPVICVGNLVAGGTGKTPVSLSLIAAAKARGLTPHALSRGHGGREKGPLRVDPARHQASDVGDEPLLLAAAAPCWIAADRRQGARAAIAAGADLIIMDDGFQNPGIAKDLSVIVVDGAVGFGNGLMIPAGPLREPVGRGLARAQAVVVMGDDLHDAASATRPLPLLQGRLVPDMDGSGGAPDWLDGSPVIAFAGIGRPQKFFETLTGLGARLVETHPFPDHHPYLASEIEELDRRASAAGARLVTTAKDAVRIAPGLRDRIDGRLRILPVRVEWTRPQAMDQLLDQLFSSSRGMTGSTAPTGGQHG